MRRELVLRDPSVIRALAHPLRIRMLTVLQREGPATATMLSSALGESTGATSYHLRRLARYGLVEEDVARGNGRDRWWKAAATHYNLDSELTDSAEHEAARAELLARVIERDAAVVAAFVENRSEFDAALREAATVTNYVLHATPGEVNEVRAEIHAALARLEPPDRPEGRPERARFYAVFHLVPLVPEEGTGADAAAG